VDEKDPSTADISYSMPLFFVLFVHSRGDLFSIEFVDEGEHFHLYLETDDAAATADALKRNGVHLMKDVHETTWGTREFISEEPAAFASIR
jgi:hypothetical protein